MHIGGNQLVPKLYWSFLVLCIYNTDMSHDMTKPTKWHVHPAKMRIRLVILPVWSVFAVRMRKVWVLSYPLSIQRRLWSDWADAQADLSLCWAHSHFVGFVMRWLIYSVKISVTYHPVCKKKSVLSDGSLKKKIVT